MIENKEDFGVPHLCPICGLPHFEVGQLASTLLAKAKGYTSAETKRKNNIKKYCSAAQHKERALLMKYCNWCKRKIST